MSVKITMLLKRTAINCVETCRNKLIVKYIIYRTVHLFVLIDR